MIGLEESKLLLFEMIFRFKEKLDYYLVLFLVFKTEKVLLSVLAGFLSACVIARINEI